MDTNKTFILGLMSGTSLDGVDLAYVSFEKDTYQKFEIIVAETIPYPESWRQQLQEAIYYSQQHLQQLSITYGDYLSTLINQFLIKHQLNKLDFIASHGHTILHEPEKGITLQIGDGQTIANNTNKKVVCDFRSQDVALGGQGAPLVPIGDELLFSEFDYCLNLGGFANISYRENGKRMAFDICPVNVVLNHYARKIGFEYDAEGAIAKSSAFNQSLFNSLNVLEFYEKNTPKSLGIEWVKTTIFPILEQSKASPESILRTFSDHIAWQISKTIVNDTKILCTGGGTYNAYILEKCQLFKKCEFIIPDKNLIEFKEALIFAFLGLLRVDNQINCLKSVTGARKNHSSGVIFYPNQ